MGIVKPQATHKGLALELDLTPKGLKYVQNAMMSAQHLMNRVNDILAISKIAAGTP